MPLEAQKEEYEIENPDGGLNTQKPAHLISPKQSPTLQNSDPTFNGGTKKRLGHIKFTSAAKVTPTGTFCSGLFAGATSGGTVYVLAAEGTTVQPVTAGTWGTPITGLTITVDTPVRMFMFNDNILILNQGGGPFYTSNGTSASALGGTPPANAKLGMVHRNRVFLSTGANSVVAHSALLNEQDYTTTDNAGTLTFNKGDGMVVNGMCSGVDFAIISKISAASGGKEGKLYILYGASPFDWNAKKIADVGAVSHEGMIAYDNFVVVATTRGIYGIQGRYPFKMSEPIQQTYGAIPSKGTIAIGKYQTKLYFGYPASGTANNRELVVDVERGVWTLNTGKTPRVYANHPDGRLLFGTSGTSLLVWEAENGANDDSAAIDFIWESPDIFFDSRWSPSRLDMAYVHVDASPTATITATHYVDGTVDSFSDTITTNTQAPIKKLKHFIGTRGTYHRIRLRDNSTSGQTTIYGLKALGKAFEPGTQRSA